MKRSIFRSNRRFFHVSLEFHMQNLFKDLDWIFIQRKINDAIQLFQIEVQALVMMDTHIHLLVTTFEKNENFFCEHLQIQIRPEARLENLSEPILNYSQYLNTYKYIYRNPVEAGLCRQVQDYPYSSLALLMGLAVPHCQIHDQLGLIQNPIHILKWLNYDMDYKISQIKLLRHKSSLSM